MTFPNPAGRPSLNLVATVRSRLTKSPIERLQTPTDLNEWLSSQGLPASTSTHADLTSARALREAIHALVTAALSASEPDPAALDIVNEFAQHPDRPRLYWTRCGYTSTGTTRTARVQLAAVAADAITLLAGPDVVRLHQCEAENCGTAFLLNPSTHTRRWCSSTTCGNRARVNAHRQRASRSTT